MGPRNVVSGTHPDTIISARCSRVRLRVLSIQKESSLTKSMWCIASKTWHATSKSSMRRIVTYSLSFPLASKFAAALIAFVVHTSNMVPKVNAVGHYPAHWSRAKFYLRCTTCFWSSWIPSEGSALAI
jgi:predicted RecB family nuclease